MDIDGLIREVRAARKYRCIDDAAVARICREEAAKHAGQKEAAKAAKRRLHQISGAFLGGALDAAGEEALLRAHASTRERLGFYGEFFADIDACAGAPGSLLDLACGINPLLYLRYRAERGLPMPRYAAYDIRLDALDAVRRGFARYGVRGFAEPLDLLGGAPGETGDIALMLKIVPLLERQRAGRYERVIDQARARFVAVSFPTRSLGGRGLGMAAQYRRLFAGYLARAGHRLALEKEYANELLFVLDKGLNKGLDKELDEEPHKRGTGRAGTCGEAADDV
jgi:16S rRNA (guanine(1405)-N(7))-methyltransferase